MSSRLKMIIGTQKKKRIDLEGSVREERETDKLV